MSGMRVLLLGGTGAMGPHVANILAETGHKVTVTSRKERKSKNHNITYLCGNAREKDFLAKALAGNWDVIVDFMKWGSYEFHTVMPFLLHACDQYVFLSSYRVYSDAPVLCERTPRLLESVEDQQYLATDEYALAKARCEDTLVASGSNRWTIVRPAITYDGQAARLQLASMETGTWLWRALRGIPVPFPQEMLAKQTTMTWARDVARMICGLIGCPAARGEVYNVSTSDHMSWAEVLAVYRRVLPFEVKWCGLGEYERAMGGVYQIRFDRMYDRVVDNQKMLSATNLKQSDLTSMAQGIAAQLLTCLNANRILVPDVRRNARLDAVCGGMPSLKEMMVAGLPINLARYARHRLLL